LAGRERRAPDPASASTAFGHWQFSAPATLVVTQPRPVPSKHPSAAGQAKLACWNTCGKTGWGGMHRKVSVGAGVRMGGCCCRSSSLNRRSRQVGCEL
jgi:hypothetical protein